MWKPQDTTTFHSGGCDCVHCKDHAERLAPVSGPAQPISLEEKIERLEVFRDGMLRVPEANFDLSSWVDGNSPRKLLKWPEESCGTTGCAVGWLPAIIPSVFKYTKCKSEVCLKTDKDEQVSGYDAARMYFDLSEDEASDLFFPENYRTPGYDLEWDTDNGPRDQSFETFDDDFDLKPKHVAARMSYMIDKFKKELCQQKQEGSAPSA